MLTKAEFEAIRKRAMEATADPSTITEPGDNISKEDYGLAIIHGDNAENDSEFYLRARADALKLLAEVARYKSALLFYADEDNYEFFETYDGGVTLDSKVQTDAGQVARDALSA